MGLRERNKQDKLQRLTQAARELFADKGFHAATIREIAERAGIGVGTVFLYAKDKQDLLFLLFHEAVAQVQEEAFASLPSGQGLLAELLHVFGRFYDYYAKDVGLSRLYAKELLFLSEGRAQEMSALTQGFVGRLAQLVFRAQERGEVRADVSPLQAGANLFALYYVCLVAWLGGTVGSAGEARAFLGRAVELQLRGLFPAGALDRAAHGP